MIFTIFRSFIHFDLCTAQTFFEKKKLLFTFFKHFCVCGRNKKTAAKSLSALILRFFQNISQPDQLSDEEIMRGLLFKKKIEIAFLFDVILQFQIKHNQVYNLFQMFHR